VTEDQRYTLIEYISHLVNSDYARVAEDLVRLGFVPPEFVDPEKTAAVVPQLSRVLGQLTQGGGARKVNVQQVLFRSLSFYITKILRLLVYLK
jgi:aarF domain-containing kinase